MIITFDKDVDVDTGDISVYRVYKDGAYIRQQYVFPTGTADDSIATQIETDLTAKGYT